MNLERMVMDSPRRQVDEWMNSYMGPIGFQWDDLPTLIWMIFMGKPIGIMGIGIFPNEFAHK